MVAAATVRASGQTTAEEVLPDAVDGFDQPADTEPEKTLNLTRAFQRMRTDWNSKDRETIHSVKSIVDQQILKDFRDAFSLMFEIHNTVRTTVGTDEFGLPIWKTNRDGSYVEDWEQIKRKDRERFLHIIITRMFEWEQTAADIWGEAIFAKAQLDEAFATGFDSIADPKTTVDARTARANRLSADHRYLAVYKSYYSRKAEALVRSMAALSQRFKDLHVS